MTKKKSIILLIIVAILIVATVVVVALVPKNKDEDRVSLIGIGGGGAFFNPLIDPNDSDIYYVTSDMGGLYYSYNKGQTWDRSYRRGVFSKTAVAADSTLFCGGYGLYSSIDKGKTLELIYPQNEQYSVSRAGWHENLMLAEVYYNENETTYDNGYIRDITTTEDKVYFATLNWNERNNFKLLSCDYNGDNLTLLYEETIIGKSVGSFEVYLAVKDNGIYFSLEERLCFYDFENQNCNTIYNTTGKLRDVEIIGEYLFFIDDVGAQSKILYTKDFPINQDLANFQDLMDYNNLPTTFTKYGIDGTFEWHFKELSGNNFENIYLSFSSFSQELNDSVDGIMKFNGQAFEWVFDSMYKTRSTVSREDWSYGSHGPFYGITKNPHDDDMCLVSNIESVYVMHYANEEDREVYTTHTIVTKNGETTTFSTNGLNVQTTYSVHYDPFNTDHIIICTTDLGLQNSYDGGKTWQRMTITGTDYSIYNTCYDLYFDPDEKDVVYGLWSSRHDAPYDPTTDNRDTTKGVFAVSYDGGNTWDMNYSSGLPTDSIPVKMSVNKDANNFTIAVATFNRGFYLSQDGGKTFTDINDGIETVSELIYGEDIVLDDDTIYMLTAPYQENNEWKSSRLYKHTISSGENQEISLVSIDKDNVSEGVVLVRSLTYSKEKGLYLNVMPTFNYEWFMELNNGFWVNHNGGIYHYNGQTFDCIFGNDDGIFNSAFSPDGTMYAVDEYGTIYVESEGEFSILVDNLFTMLKNISFSPDGEILYVTAFGGGVYKILL